jgi:hypothetical protein
MHKIVLFVAVSGEERERLAARQPFSKRLYDAGNSPSNQRVDQKM